MESMSRFVDYMDKNRYTLGAGGISVDACNEELC
jgi:hypothetical protein